MTGLEITAIVVVCLFIVLCPIAFNLFGAEYKKKDGSCGTETLWDRIKAKFKK